MYTINADFQPFSRLNIGDLYGHQGVYVLWDAHAKAKPTYIGEGHLLKRLSDHSQRDGRKFARPLDGYIAIIDGSTRGVHKLESLAVERLLLDVARDTDRDPAVNVRPGASSIVRLLCEVEPTLCVAVRGYDPLLPPWESRPLAKVKQIKARQLDADTYNLVHDWRYRRRRSPIA